MLPWRACLTLLLALASAAHAQLGGPPDEPRMALVVGNAEYENGPLRNPVNDADDIATALEGLGFAVTKVKNGSNRQMKEAVENFTRQLRKGGVGIFFFAGHGVQARGRNYLMPVNARVNSEVDLEFEALDANFVLAKMEDAGNRVNIIILDACRDNPYGRSFRNAGRGLAQMDAAKGSLIAFATGPGSVAADGVGRNGLYTQHLLESLKHPDSDVDKVFRRVAADVSAASGNRQIPWKSDSLTGEFHFRRGAGDVAAAPAALAPSANTRATELALWETVKDSNSPAELQAYLDQFPNGVFSGVARARLKSLIVPKAVATREVTMPGVATAPGPRPPVQMALAPGSSVAIAQSAKPPCAGAFNPVTWNHCSGAYTFPDGSKCIGEYLSGMRHGQGVYTFVDGRTYAGDFFKDTQQGHGTLSFPNGEKYVGNFLDGKFHGNGAYTYANGAQYTGEYRNHKANGKGAQTFANGDRYVGEFRDDKAHGQGTYTFPNGERYVGEFVEEKYHGKGTYTYPSGEKYVGEYRNHRANGRGTHTYPNGDQYTGDFRDDKFEGRGTFLFKDGQKYVGEFRDGKRNGEGVLYWPDGTVSRSGRWVNDAPAP